MKHCKTLIVGLFLFLMVLPGKAQNDSLGNLTNTDTIEAVVKNYNQRLLELEKQRIIDSVQKAGLEQEIVSLGTSDKVKRGELENALQLLQEKEVLRISEKKKQIAALKKTVTGHPVMGFFSDTLFLIHTKLGSFSGKERADAVTRRIKKLTDVVGFSSDSLRIIESETTFDLVYGESMITSVSENDALWNDTTQFELAKQYKAFIGDAVMKYRSETNVIAILKKVALALLVILVIGLLIKYVSKLFQWLELKITQQKNRRIKGITFKNYTFFDAERQLTVFLFINKLLKWLTIAISIYISLPVLFGIFPWTQNFADTLFGYIFNPVKKILIAFWGYLPDLITIIVIVVVFRYVLKAVKFLKNEIQNGKLTIPGFYPDWATPTYQLIRIMIIAFMIVVIFPYLPGSDSPVFKGVSVFLGFLFTFGSAGSLSNIIAGLVLTYMRLFKIGDRVKIGDVLGDVIEKSTLVTRVRTTKNEIISIPNSTVMNSHTINYSSDAPEKGLIIHTTVTIGYDIPWKEMHEALIEAAKRTELVLPEPEPFVLQTSLDDFYVSYQINAYIREPNKQAGIYSSLHQNIQDVCFERGIEILSPHYRAARDGNMSTIPAKYLPKGYSAPGFNIFTKKKE